MAKASSKKEEAAPPPPKRGNKWLIALVAVLALVLAAGGSAVWAIKKSQSHDSAEEESDAAKKVASKSNKQEQIPLYVRLEPLTVKLQSDTEGAEKYLQLLPELKALDAPAIDKIKAYLPQLRHEMLSLMSSKKPSELATPQGIEKLAFELRARVNQSFGNAKTPPSSGDKAGPEETVQAVLFSSFIVQ